MVVKLSTSGSKPRAQSFANHPKNDTLLKIVSALARQQAKLDHEREVTQKNETSCNLR